MRSAESLQFLNVIYLFIDSTFSWNLVNYYAVFGVFTRYRIRVCFKVTQIICKHTANQWTVRWLRIEIAYPIMPIIINIMRMYTAVPFHKKIVRARHWICHTVSAIALCVYLWNEFTSIWTKSMQIMRLIFIDCVRLMPRSDEKYNEVQRM